VIRDASAATATANNHYCPSLRYLPQIDVAFGDSVRVVCINGPAAHGAESWSALMAKAPLCALQPAEAHGTDDVACLVYTSGTTGNPKAVTVTNGACRPRRRPPRSPLALTPPPHPPNQACCTTPAP